MAPIPTPRLPLWLRALHSSARYTATASVRGLLVAEIQVFVPYRIHPSIHPLHQEFELVGVPARCHVHQEWLMLRS